MKKQNKAFTLAETLVVLCVIGVITVLMLSSFGNKINRNKAMFKKAYSLTERTVVELVNDETYYPYDYKNFGFKEHSDVKILGPDYYTSTTNYNSPVTVANTDWSKQDLSETDANKYRRIKFCNLFSNNLNLEAKTVFDNSGKNCSFTTTDGIKWTIYNAASTDNVSGFLIAIDVNGDKVPNAPTLTTIRKNTSSSKDLSNVKNRDKFYMYVRYDGKMQLHDNDKTAKSFLKATDFKDDEQ